jgi:S1-C subfamily serine protease
MERLTTYFGVAAAVIVVVFVAVFWDSATTVENPTTALSPASPALATSTSPLVASSTPKQATTSPSQKVAAAPRPPERNAALDAAAGNFLNSLVNILCFAPEKSGLHSMSGSGVLIDPKGIILTNAHVAQYFLFADRGVVCSIRSGRPAVDRYMAKPIYIPSRWVEANPGVIAEEGPSGTGEYDYALLAVNSGSDSSKVPSSFPYVPLATEAPVAKAAVLIGSYGAGTLETNQILTNLYSTLVLGSVKQVLTFGDNTPDMLWFVGSPASQEGSSGGGVVDESGQLVATVTTSTLSGDASIRSLGAITSSYIRREFASETGGSLDTLLSEPVETAIASFATQAPVLEAILSEHLP